MNFLVYLLLFLCIWKESITREDVTVSSSTCKNTYTMEDINEAYVTYRGGELGGELGGECYIKFINWDSFQKDLCVKPVKMRLACSSEIEYFRHFISEYLEPKRRFSCRNESTDEWCGGVRTSYFYIVFKQSARDYDSDTILHVYLKDFPKEKDVWDDSSGSSTNVTMALVIALIVAVIVVVLTVILVIVLRRNRALRLPYSGPIPMHTSSTPLQPQYLPQQQQPVPAQGNYQWHPMQSAYPMSAHDSHNPSITQQQTPSAPTLDNTAPPPPYHSVVK